MVEPLAWFADQRSAMMPAPPTSAELGVGEAHILELIGMFGSPRTAAAMPQRLEVAPALAPKDTDDIEPLRTMGPDKVDMAPDQLTDTRPTGLARMEQPAARTKAGPQ